LSLPEQTLGLSLCERSTRGQPGRRQCRSVVDQCLLPPPQWAVGPGTGGRGSFTPLTSGEIVPPTLTVTRTAEGYCAPPRSLHRDVRGRRGPACGDEHWHLQPHRSEWRPAVYRNCWWTGCVHPTKCLARHAGCHNCGWDRSIRRSHGNVHGSGGSGIAQPADVVVRDNMTAATHAA
jgi:hypothetical protein